MKKFDDYNQKFSIKTIYTIKNGIYNIESKFINNLFVTFPNHDQPSKKNSILSKSDDDKNQLFYINFDPHDGCYSIIDIKNNNCLSTVRNSAPKSSVDQNKFHNLDHQKWIISSFDVKRGNFFLELKSTLLRLDASSNKENNIPLQIDNCNHDKPLLNQQLFRFKSVEFKDEEKMNELEKLVKDQIELKYSQILDVDKNVNEINDELFENNLYLKSLVIPSHVTKISKNAFINCKNISNYIGDPKWLKLLPNPINVTTVLVSEGVKEIKEDDFTKLRNLNILQIPKSLKQIHQNAFDNILNIESFKGDPKFLEYNPVSETGLYSKDYQPLGTDLSEISKLCGAVCHEIYESFEIYLRPVQILVILRMADDILNNKETHGSIGEIKTGEGKSIIITTLSIILVKYNRKIDIVTSNLQLAQRDQNEQEKYFRLFDIETGVLYSKEKDADFMSQSMKLTFTDDNTTYSSYNINVFEYPVVYSTNGNYEFVYLNSIFSLNPRNREYDVVLVDEVDNMFIDEYSSPAIIARKINYFYSKEIFQIVFLLHEMQTSEIIKMLKYFLPNASEFKEEDIVLLKSAARSACNNIKNVDYIVNNGKVVIIDSNTGFKKVGTRWNKYIHEMIEIKEGIEPEMPSISYCQVTQHSYFNLYNKIIGVTGTIGDQDDEELLKEGYNINIFKVPRHLPSQLKATVKNRPELTSDIYEAVFKEIIKEKNKGRPVLVIWDSIDNATKFIESKSFLSVQQILGLNPETDKESIKNAGNTKIVTISTSAAGRGVDIKLSKESLEAGGLHVIIPMAMASQRSLEQAAGRSARQGQPRSVTFFKSDNDKFTKSCDFNKGDENLVKLELNFAKYIKNNFPWMLQGPNKYSFINNSFPYAADYTVVLNILARRLAFMFNLNPFEEYNQKYKDLALQMVQLAWGSFFSDLSNNSDDCDDWNYCKYEYKLFLKELTKWFDPNKSKTVKDSIRYIRLTLIREIDLEFVIVSGIKITKKILCVVFPTVAPYIKLISGVVLSGGLEIYHQLQNGDQINWAQVLIRAGGAAVRSIIYIRFSMKTEFWDMLIYFGDNWLSKKFASINTNIKKKKVEKKRKKIKKMKNIRKGRKFLCCQKQ